MTLLQMTTRAQISRRNTCAPPLVADSLACSNRRRLVSSSNPLEIMARLGYGARGVVYCLVGGLAVLAAIGSGGQTGGSRSALRTLLDQPFGDLIIIAIALGLAFFAAWRLIEPITDADHRGGSGKALAVRGAHFLSGLVYAGLALSALRLALGRPESGGDDQSARDWTAWLLEKPFGQWLVGLVGLAIIGAGVAFLLKGWRGNVTEKLHCDQQTSRWAVPLGRMGFIARGIVFVLIGGFLVVAAWYSSSQEVIGLGGALAKLGSQRYGRVLLGVTAAGLFAFGVFGFVQARFRRIDAPDLEDAKDAVANSMQAVRH
jgi:hypothetical protein